MDDVDEGIGSNESTLSNKETSSLIDSLNYLNGIQTDTNGEDDHRSIHCSFTNGLPDGKDLSNDKNFNNCTNGEKSSEDIENHYSALNGHIKGNEKKSVAMELANLVEDKDETVTTVLLADTDTCDKGLMTSIISNVNNVKDDQKGCAFTETQFHEETQRLIAEKSSFNSKENEKSPFVLDDKIRNSLKGLVAKIKYIPDRKSDVKNITESDEIYNTDRPEMTAIKKETSIEKLQKSDKQMLHEERYNNDVKSSDKTTPGVIQDGTDKSNCTSLEIQSNDAVASEKLINREVSILSLDADILENFDNDEGIPMEIGSDNEDLLLQMSPENHKTNEYVRKPSIDEVQFDDSQSSDNSGKINIAKILSDDLPNSPLAVSESRNSNKPTTLDLNFKKSRSEFLPNVELDSKSDAKSSVELVRDTGNDEVSTVFKLSNKCQEVNLAVSEISEEILNAKEKNEISYNSELNGKYAHDNNIQQKMLEAKIVHNTDMDDIIFEGETKPESNSKLEVKIIKDNLLSKTNGNSQIVSANASCMNVVDKKIEITVNDLTTNEHINVSASDDDVIFEKEVKADDISKPNCDISRINTNEAKTCVNNQDLPSSSENKFNSQSESRYSNLEHLGAAQKSDRKRPAEEKEINETLFKRSKLQGLIGKLEARVEPSKIEANDEPASIELSDSDGDDSATTDTAQERNSVHCEVDGLVKNQNVKPKTITLTELEMDQLVREKVKAYLTSQRDTIIARLSQKIKELQTSNDLWKRQVKDLQVKVNDVTVLQKKLERRKAATAALRQITTKHAAVQVEDGRVASASKPKVAVTPTKTNTAFATVEPNGDTRTIRLPIPQSTVNQSVFTLPQSSQLVPDTNLSPIKNLLDMTRIQRTVGSVPPVTSSAKTSIVSLLQCPMGYVNQTSNTQGYLTMPGANVSKVVAKTVQVPSAANTITLTSPNSKVIDLTDDDENQKTCLVTLSSGLTMNTPGLRHVLAAPPGTQLVRTGSSAQPTYQLVFNSTTPALRPASTMVVASNPGKTETLPTVSPQRVVKLTPAAGITSGTTLAQVVVTSSSSVVTPKMTFMPITHPAPFPTIPKDQTVDGLKAIPPKPSLKISRVSQGIVLSWNMVMTDNVAEISIYQLFAYQETSAPPSSALWKKVGDVKALPLPMACTLTQFQVGNKYHFAVRAMDVHKRVGQFSDPGSIHLTPGPPFL